MGWSGTREPPHAAAAATGGLYALGSTPGVRAVAVRFPDAAAAQCCDDRRQRAPAAQRAGRAEPRPAWPGAASACAGSAGGRWLGRVGAGGRGRGLYRRVRWRAGRRIGSADCPGRRRRGTAWQCRGACHPAHDRRRPWCAAGRAVRSHTADARRHECGAGISASPRPKDFSAGGFDRPCARPRGAGAAGSGGTGQDIRPGT